MFRTASFSFLNLLKMYVTHSFYLLLICLVGAYAKVDIAALPQQTQDLIKTVHETCVKEVGIDEELVAKGVKGELVDDEKLKCYSKCILIESGVMDEKGVVTTDTLTELMPEKLRETQKTYYDDCSQKVDADDICEKAFDLMKCVHDMDPENFIFV